jgi:hypothetical protein
MPLTAGTKLGPYEILSLLGAGGMSACGHAAPPRRISDRAALGVGPQRHCRQC